MRGQSCITSKGIDDIKLAILKEANRCTKFASPTGIASTLLFYLVKYWNFLSGLVLEYSNFRHA